MVPAAGAMEEERRSWMLKREGEESGEVGYREAPATMRIALLTKRAKVKREMQSSA